MVEVRITSDVDRFLSDLQEAASDLIPDLENATAEALRRFEADLRGAAPTDSGRLARSESTAQTGLSAAFGNAAPYASYAHDEGGETGDYARETARLFEAHLGDELTAAFEAVTAEVLGGGDG